MNDDFAAFTPSLTSPASSGMSIEPNDESELAHVTRALYVGQAGSVRVRLHHGSEVTFQDMQAGALYPLRVRQVFASGTTAGGLVGLQ